MNLCTCILSIQTHLDDDLKKRKGTTAKLDNYSVIEGLFLT